MNAAPRGATWVVRHTNMRGSRTAHLMYNGHSICGKVPAGMALLTATTEPRCGQCAKTWLGEATP